MAVRALCESQIFTDDSRLQQCAHGDYLCPKFILEVPSQRLWFWLVNMMGHRGCSSAAPPETRQCGSW